MKIRTSFVSNSSSSSFVLFVDKIPENQEEAKQLFFPCSNDDTRICDPYNTDEEDGFSIGEAVDVLMYQIESWVKLSRIRQLKELIQEFQSLNYMDYALFEIPELDTNDYRSSNQLSCEIACRHLRSVLKKMQGKKIIRITLGDENSRLEGWLEHGEHVRSVPGTIIISHH